MNNIKLLKKIYLSKSINWGNVVDLILNSPIIDEKNHNYKGFHDLYQLDLYLVEYSRGVNIHFSKIWYGLVNSNNNKLILNIDYEDKGYLTNWICVESEYQTNYVIINQNNI